MLPIFYPAMAQGTSSVCSARRNCRMCICTATDVKSSLVRISISVAAAMQKDDTRSFIRCTLLMIRGLAFLITRVTKRTSDKQNVRAEMEKNAGTVRTARDVHAGAIRGLLFTIVSWVSMMSLVCLRWWRILLARILFYNLQKQEQGSSH